MKQIKATPPPKLLDKKLYRLAVVYALVIVVCMLGQLFRFDNIIATAAEADRPIGQLAVVFWTVLQVLQLFALPFLLRVRVSRLMRIVSLVAAMIVPVFWAVITGWQLSVANPNLGIFGTEVEMLNVWWISAIATVIGIAGASAAIGSIAASKKQLVAALRK